MMDKQNRERRVMSDIRSHQRSHRRSEWSYQHFLFGSPSLNNSDLNLVGVGGSMPLQPVRNFQPLLRLFQPSVGNQRQIRSLTCQVFPAHKAPRTAVPQQNEKEKWNVRRCMAPAVCRNTELLFRTQEVAEKSRSQTSCTTVLNVS